MGQDGIIALCELAKELRLSLNVKALNDRIASELEIEARPASQLVMGALLPLNNLRVRLRLETPNFLDVLSESIEKEAPEKWRADNLTGWHAIREQITPLFEKDNFFSLCNKSYQLLVNRPNPVQDVKILTELRPVYSEEATSIKAFVLTKTLVVEYMEGEDKKVIHLSMDMDDLRSLSLEVERAKLKRETLSEEVFSWGVEVLTYGQQG